MQTPSRLPAAGWICLVTASLAAGVSPLAGCGARERATTTTTTTPPETSDRRPPLPKGWRRVVNRRAGFSFGLPSEWHSRGGRTTFLLAPNGAVAATISADRSSDGRETSNPGDYAVKTTRSLRGYRKLQLRGFERLGGASYPTSVMRATGTLRRRGVRLDITVAAIRRPGLVTFSMIFFRSTRTRASVYQPVIKRMIRSFRAQTPQF